MIPYSSVPRPVKATVFTGNVHIAGNGGAGGRWMLYWSPATWLNVLLSRELPRMTSVPIRACSTGVNTGVTDLRPPSVTV
jgi:hypothetical protein